MWAVGVPAAVGRRWRAGGALAAAAGWRPVPVPGVATILVGWTRWRRDLASLRRGRGPGRIRAGCGACVGPTRRARTGDPPAGGPGGGRAGRWGAPARDGRRCRHSSVVTERDRESRYRFSRQRSPVRDSHVANPGEVAARGRGRSGMGRRAVRRAARNVEGPPGSPRWPSAASAPVRGYRTGEPPGPC